MEQTPQQPPKLRSFIYEADYSSVENFPVQSNALLLPKNGLLNSNTMKEAASDCDIGSIESTATELKRKTTHSCNTLMDDEDLENMTNQIGFHYNVEGWLPNQPSSSNSNNWKMDFCTRSPHLSGTFTRDKRYSSIDAADNRQFSITQFRSAAACWPHEKIPLHRSERLKSNLPEIDLTNNQKSFNCQSSTDDMEFSNVVISSDLNKISSDNEKSDVLVNLNQTDNDCDIELFYNVSIPSSLCKQDFVMQTSQQLATKVSKGYHNGSFSKTSNKVKQTSTLSSREVGSHNGIKSVQESYHNQFVPTCNTYPTSEKPGRIFFSKVNQDKVILLKEGSVECSWNSSSYSQKTRELPLLGDNLIPERTSGGFHIPNICQNYSCIRKSRPATLASCKTGSKQNLLGKSEMYKFTSCLIFYFCLTFVRFQPYFLMFYIALQTLIW